MRNDLFSSAVDSLKETPLRSFLSSLGILIGVASVYLMLSIGAGTKREISELIDTVQARSIYVQLDISATGRVSRAKAPLPFSENELEAIRNIADVLFASGVLSRTKNVSSDYSDTAAPIRGIDNYYLESRGIELFEGRSISQADLRSAAPVAVLGVSTSRNLFPATTPIGKRIKVEGVPFKVVGITSDFDGTTYGDPNNFVLIPRSTARNRLIGAHSQVRENIDAIIVVGRSQDKLDHIEMAVQTELRRSRRITQNDDQDFRILNFSATREAYARSQTLLSLLLATMGSVSLIVGGVGVMNIMLVNVRERTSEIGLRVAIGAKPYQILVQFLFEATVLCFVGGLLGLAMGVGLSNLPVIANEVDISFSPAIAITSLSSALLVGTLFGIFPAYQASRLHPIEALKSD